LQQTHITIGVAKLFDLNQRLLPTVQDDLNFRKLSRAAGKKTERVRLFSLATDYCAGAGPLRAFSSFQNARNGHPTVGDIK